MRLSPSQRQWGGVLFAIWLGLTNSLHYQELLAGLILSAAIVWLTVPLPAANEPMPQWRPAGLIAFIPVFVKNLILANIDVALRVLDPKLPINPGIVQIHTTLATPYQRLILANSITLTPGTITLDMQGDAMYIHWLDVKDSAPDAAGARIKSGMEEAIARFGVRPARHRQD